MAATLAAPRRSVLYVPGSNRRAIDKARSLAADAVILDLEDAVAPEAKTAARDQVGAAAAAGGFAPRQLAIRVNGLGTAWFAADVAMAAAAGIDAVVVPKVESAAQLRAVVGALEAQAATPSLRIWAMIETPMAILKLADIAAAHPRLDTLVLGTSDLVNDLHARHTRERFEVLVPLAMVVIAARAHGLYALDGVHLALGDDAGFQYACEQARNLGFDGKTLIHPAQIAGANQHFGPSEADLERARRRIAAFEVARAAGDGVVVVDGQLIEELHIHEARRLLALATVIAR